LATSKVTNGNEQGSIGIASPPLQPLLFDRRNLCLTVQLAAPMSLFIGVEFNEEEQLRLGRIHPGLLFELCQGRTHIEKRGGLEDRDEFIPVLAYQFADFRADALGRTCGNLAVLIEPQGNARFLQEGEKFLAGQSSPLWPRELPSAKNAAHHQRS